MELYVDNRSGTPIYRQIVEQLTGQILSGVLPPDAPLPSIRNLAKDLRISVITTKRAYEELEQAGLICMVPGRGCFVSAPNTEALREATLREVEEHLRVALDLARTGGIDQKTLEELWTLMMEE